MRRRPALRRWRPALKRLNEELAAETSAVALANGERVSIRLEAGIGINTGNLGIQDALQLSVFGDAVNLASRLEGESKVYGVPIVIGEETEKPVEGFATLELDNVPLKGKRELTRTYALLGDRALAKTPSFSLSGRIT